MPVFKSYVLTDLRNSFYAFCHLLCKSDLVVEWFTLIQGEWVSLPGRSERPLVAVEPYSLTCLCCGCQFLISSASPMFWPILVALQAVPRMAKLEESRVEASQLFPFAGEVKWKCGWQLRVFYDRQCDTGFGLNLFYNFYKKLNFTSIWLLKW